VNSAEGSVNSAPVLIFRLQEEVTSYLHIPPSFPLGIYPNFSIELVTGYATVPV